MAADTEPIEILLHLPLLAEDKVIELCWRLASIRVVCLEEVKKPDTDNVLCGTECAICIRQIKGSSGACLWGLQSGMRSACSLCHTRCSVLPYLAGLVA